MIIDRIARTVMENFEESEAIIAIADRDGCYVSSKTDEFEGVFADPQILDGICSQIDDGCEPATSVIGGYFVAGYSINSNGYAILLVPNYTSEKAAAYHDLAEIVLKQVAMLAENAITEAQASIFTHSSELLAVSSN
ncbi:MAG: hypothetical protein LLF92_08265 [Planctomycetaceae bacterium]|nr:hypothetical protein [Planctomycetaceae bacterium]